MVPPPTGQFMDRRIASTPLLALKSKIGAPPEIRSVLCDPPPRTLHGGGPEPLTASALSCPSAARKTDRDARFISMQRVFLRLSLCAPRHDALQQRTR